MTIDAIAMRRTLMDRRAVVLRRWHEDERDEQDLLSEDITERTERATDQALATAIHGRRETDMRNLDEIAAAILRVDAESYGKCLDCGTLIASTRLLVRPEAPYCSECAEARETGERVIADARS
jgi:DnaK suppressor protein